MRIALTFDDGPSGWTGPILDLLHEHDAHATFFVCGHAIAGREDLLAWMVKNGHEVGNHSYSHPHLTKLGNADMRSELRGAQETIHRATGVYPRRWRAPYLDTNERVNLAAANLGLRHVGITVETSDWALGDPAEIARRAGLAADGDIILLHDGIPPDGGSGTNSRQPTVDALDLILQRTGVEWVTVSELQHASAAA